MTVIELAIAIIILGALFALVLKGRPMIDEMKAVAVGHQMRNLQNRVLDYQTMFGQLPGDDRIAASRFNLPPAITLSDGRPASTPGDGTLEGFFDDVLSPNSEHFMAWRHMRAAGLLDGDISLAGASARPSNPFGGVYGFDQGNLGQPRGSVCATRIPGRAALSIDRSIDDGAINRGALVATSAFDSAGAFNHFEKPDSQTYDVEKEYIICLPILP